MEISAMRKTEYGQPSLLTAPDICAYVDANITKVSPLLALCKSFDIPSTFKSIRLWTQE